MTILSLAKNLVKSAQIQRTIKRLKNEKNFTLHESHLELGAKIVPFAGFSMPIQYNSVKEEILVRKSVGMFDVSHMGEFFISGEDTTKFINYLLPNDYEALFQSVRQYTLHF